MKDTELAQIALTHDHTGASQSNLFIYRIPTSSSRSVNRTHTYKRILHALHLKKHLQNLKRASPFATSSGMAQFNLYVTSSNLVMKFS